MYENSIFLSNIIVTKEALSLSSTCIVASHSYIYWCSINYENFWSICLARKRRVEIMEKVLCFKHLSAGIVIICEVKVACLCMKRPARDIIHPKVSNLFHFIDWYIIIFFISPLGLKLNDETHEREIYRYRMAFKKIWILYCKGRTYESWKTMGGATFTKGVHVFTLINLEDFMKILNKTQMIRHRILGDLLGASLVVRFDAVTIDIFIFGPIC